MPHLHIKEFKEIELPVEQDEVRFNFIAKNANHLDERLISTTVEGEDFFLLVKVEENKSLLKLNKMFCKNLYIKSKLKRYE